MDDSSEVFDDEDDLELYEAADEKVLHRKDNWICPCSPLSLSALFVMLFLFLLVCSIVLGLVLPFELGTVNRGSTFYYHNPGDTRTVAYSFVFCERVAVTAGEGVEAGLYAVSRQPESVLTGDSAVMIGPELITLAPGNSREWHFHLHPESEIRIDVDISTATTATAKLLILKGLSEFQSFSSGRVFSIFHTYNISQRGSDMKITEEDDYYFVFTNDERAPMPADFDGSIEINRAQLSLADQEFSCMANNSSACSIANFQNRWYILSIIRANGYDDAGEVPVTTECVKRAVAFILIPIVPVAIFFALTFVLFIPCVGICRNEWKHIAKQRKEMLEAAANKDEKGRRVIFRNKHITKTGKLRYSAQKQSKYPPTVALDNPIGVGNPSS